MSKFRRFPTSETIGIRPAEVNDTFGFTEWKNASASQR